MGELVADRRHGWVVGDPASHRRGRGRGHDDVLAVEHSLGALDPSSGLRLGDGVHRCPEHHSVTELVGQLLDQQARSPDDPILESAAFDRHQRKRPTIALDDEQRVQQRDLVRSRPHGSGNADPSSVRARGVETLSPNH